MTSAEFAGKYRLLKNVADRGARTFLAQQTALGRMVMVHYLDAGSAADRQTSLSRLQSLRPAAREKVLEITDVDGVPVAVTLYITSFGDLSTWLEQNLDSPKQDLPSAPPAGSFGGEFTRAFGKVDPPRSAPEQPAAQRAPSAPPAEGEFTRQFGKIGTPPPSDLAPTPANRPAAAAPAQPRDPVKPPPPQFGQPDEVDEPTLIIEAVKPPAPAPKPAPAPIAAAPAPRPVAPPRPAAPPPAAPPPPAPSAPAQGEFTRMFSGLDAGTMGASGGGGAAKDVRGAPPAAPPPPPAAPQLGAPRPIAADQSKVPEKPAAPQRQPESAFTALFGKIDAPASASPFPSSFESVNPSPALPSALPPMGAPGKAGMVMPPVSPMADLPAPVASAPPPPPPAGGEFTQLFQRLTPTAVPPGQSEAEIARSFEPTKRADFAAPSAPPPTPVRPLGAVPSGPPPAMGGAPQMPPLAPPKPMGAPASGGPVFGAPASAPSPSPALPGANRGGPVIPSSDGPSEFTRVLGRVQAPASSPSGQTPAAAPAPAPAAQAPSPEAPPSSLKKYLPWIIIANVVLIGLAILVVYLVMKK
jgi:hypothetical protein